MKVALLPNFTRKYAKETTLNIIEKLNQLNIEFAISEDDASFLPEVQCPVYPLDFLMVYCDIVIAVGGDGTILHAAKSAAKYGKKILGINAGRLAFTAGLEAHELDLLDNLNTGDFSVDSRILLEVNIMNNGKIVKTDYCINDAVTARCGRIRLEEITVKSDGRTVNNYLSDGVIVATPTGSTAYSLSAGGPVIDPSISGILVTPICPHSLFSRSLFFSDKSELSVSGVSILDLSCDGETPIRVEPGQEIVIKKADFTADFLRIKSDTFIEILNNKLNQRMS